MTDRIDTLVIGGGQAGLATSHHLSRLGRDHVVLERNRIGDTWRRRWDSFTLVTPNWAINLPDAPPVPGPPGGFLTRDDVVDLLERYGAAIQAPVREGVEVQALDGDDQDGFVARTNTGPIRARHVIVATGFFARPRVPEFASDIPASINQLIAMHYRRPDDLPAGAVLVIGSGQTGTQIVEDLRDAGREVWLSVGRAGRIPRLYRGRDGFEWARDLGVFDWTEDKSPDPRGRFGANAHITGARGGRTINLHRFARDGVHLVGRVSGVSGTTLQIDPDLHERLAGADRSASEFKAGIDKFVAATGYDAPPVDATNSDDHQGQEGFEVPQVAELDLAASGIGSIVWAAGLVSEWPWINLPVFDNRGQPIHEEGITRERGLAFVGIRYQRFFRSDLLFGVGEDARIVVERLAAQD